LTPHPILNITIGKLDTVLRWKTGLNDASEIAFIEVLVLNSGYRNPFRIVIESPR